MESNWKNEDGAHFAKHPSGRSATVRHLFGPVWVVTISSGGLSGEIIRLSFLRAITAAEEFFNDGDFSEAKPIGSAELARSKARSDLASG